MIVRFLKNIEHGTLEAHFVNNNNIVESKVLTQVEEDGLSEIIDYSQLPKDYPLAYIAQELPELYFDNDGQETNFELIVHSFA